MAVHYKLQAEVPIKASAEQYYEIWRGRPHHLPNKATPIIQNCELHGDGSWDDHGHGSIKTWTYTINGLGDQILKERVEFDDATRTMSVFGLDGDVFKEFKVYNCFFQPIPKPEGCVLKIIVEYEKLSDDGPDAHRYLDFLIDMAKDVGSHLVKE